MHTRKELENLILMGCNNGELHSVFQLLWTPSIVQDFKMDPYVSGADSAPVFK